MITKLEGKYLVIKKKELDEYFSQFTRGVFTTEEEQKLIDQIPFNTVIEVIKKERERQGKKPNKYVVLNLEDELDLNFLTAKLERLLVNDNNVKVKDIAVDLVNAILEAKGD